MMKNQKMNAILEGFHTATPYLIVPDIEQAMLFYAAAFDVVELGRYSDENGRLQNVEITIGDSPIMISEHKTVATMPDRTLETLPPVSIYLYVADADALFAQAIAAGGRELYPVQAMSYGNREGGLADPFGNFWWIATQIA